MSQQALLQCANPLVRSAEIGWIVKNGQSPTLDTPLPFWFTAIRVTGTGDVVIQNGNITYKVTGCTQAEGFIRCFGNTILTSGTTATGITCYTTD